MNPSELRTLHDLLVKYHETLRRVGAPWSQRAKVADTIGLVRQERGFDASQE